MHQNRNTITPAHLPNLRKFLIADFWDIIPLTKNPYEVLRARKMTSRGPIYFIVYTRAGNPQHLSLNAAWPTLLRNFFNWNEVIDEYEDDEQEKKG